MAKITIGVDFRPALSRATGVGRYFEGLIDEVVIIPSAVDSDGVHTLMNSTYPTISIDDDFLTLEAGPLSSITSNGTAQVDENAISGVQRFEQEVEAALSEGGLTDNGGGRFNFLKTAFAGRLRYEGVGEPGVCRNQDFIRHDQGEVVVRLSCRAGGRFEPDLSAREKQLSESARVGHVDARLTPIELHYGEESVDPAQEPRLDQIAVKKHLRSLAILLSNTLAPRTGNGNNGHDSGQTGQRNYERIC